MRCPDCGSRMTELWLSKGILVWRCSRCGGFLVDSWTVRELKNEKLATWRRISIDKRWISGGKHLCPIDGTILIRHSGESIPAFIETSRCARCGRGGFPRDSLFVYKPAFEAKVKYYKLWNLAARLEDLMLPIVVIIVLLAGLVVALRLVQERQQVAVPARILNTKF